MARLSHPNVVHVYDAGELPGGEGRGGLFIAMEHVDGRTLRAWLAEKTRSVPEILEVFEQAGRGLAAAHAAGIVHGDFKPENVLVDGRGRARVTDFGLAHTDGRERSCQAPAVNTAPLLSALTATGHAVGTPTHAAPEQLAGGPIDHRTDQFAFCLSLYEAVCGERPLAGATETDSRVPGWLRDLVLRGLTPSAEKRHPSMDRLLQELRRRRRRGRRWMTAAAAAAAAGAIAAGVYGAASAGHARAERCQGAAQIVTKAWDEGRRREVRAALLATGRPFSEVAARGAVEALDAYAASWSSAYTDTCQATRIRGEQSEAMMDLRMRCLDRRLNELSVLVELFAHADAGMAERAVEAAEGLRDLDICADPTALQSAVEPADERLRGQVEAGRRELDRAAGLLAAGRYAQSLEAARPVVEQARTLGYGPLVAEALLARGEAEVEAGDPASAEETLRQAAREAEVARDDETRARAWISLLWVTGIWRDQFSVAYRCAEQAQAVVKRLGAGHEKMAADVHYLLGQTLRNDGRPTEALAHFQAALVLHQRALPRSHSRVLRDRLQISTLMADEGHYGDAVAEHERLIPLLEAAHGSEHPVVATARDELADWLDELGRYREALAQHERALAIRRAALDERDVELAFSLANVAAARAQLGEAHDALPIAEDALGRIERSEGRSFNWVQVSDDVAEIRRMAGRARSARAQQELTLDVARRAAGPEHPLVALALERLGDQDLDEGRAHAALAEFRQATAIHRKRFGPEHPDVARSQGGVGRALLALRRPVDALDPLERSYRAAGECTPGHAGELAFALARARWALGQRREAVEAAQAAVEHLSRGEGVDRRLLPAAKRWLERRGEAAGSS